MTFVIFCAWDFDSFTLTTCVLSEEGHYLFLLQLHFLHGFVSLYSQGMQIQLILVVPVVKK